jgi:coenzyme F420-reducing hydrogenase beta subunit
MRTPSEVLTLKETVIDGNYCIGCGICTTVVGSPFKVKMDEYGNYVAYIDKMINYDESVDLLDVCPFSGVSKNEDDLGAILYPNNQMDSYLGNYLKCYAGYVSYDSFREKGSSGGFGKWLGYILLKERKIDYFIQLVPNETQRSDVPLFNYKVFENPNEVLAGSRSSYYPSTLGSIIDHIRSVEGRYAITGIPCFIKALRLLSLKDSVVRERLKYTIGIVCGGMKSANQSKMIGWFLGVHPSNLTAIDFRGKLDDKPASHKVYKVWSNKDNLVRSKVDKEIFGCEDYGSGFFKPHACDYCDDVVNETSDISIGDAWLPKYVNDSKGTSILVVRNKEILSLLQEQMTVNAIFLDEISKEDVIKSQDGGFRHRREGLSYRIARKEKEGKWYPQKRVEANQNKITKKRQRIYSLREELSLLSHMAFLEALRQNNLNVFTSRMKKPLKKYMTARRKSIIHRLAKKIYGVSLRVFRAH